MKKGTLQKSRAILSAARCVIGTLGVSLLSNGAALEMREGFPGGYSPEAPPVKLATLNQESPAFTAETAQRFLPLLDLTHPELAEVKAQADQPNWADALDAYRDLLVAHLKTKTRFAKPDQWVLFPHWDRSRPDELLAGTACLGRHDGGASINYIGLPGAIDWFKIGVDQIAGSPADAAPQSVASSNRDFPIHLSSMHTFSVLAKAYRSTGDVKYLTAWLGSWEDFARRHKAGYAKVVDAGRLNEYNSLGASQYQQLFVAWRITNFFDQLGTIAHAMPPEHFKELSSVALAVTLTEMVNNHTAAIQKLTGVPNQARNATFAVLLSLSCIPGLAQGPTWEAGVAERVTEFYKTMIMPDGSCLEQALNYNVDNPGFLQRILALYSPERPDWLSALVPDGEKTFLFLVALLRNGSHPGTLPRIGRGNDSPGRNNSSTEAKWRQLLVDYPNTDIEKILARVYGPKDLGDPSFTSIAFPYSGYYVLRDGWRKDDAYCLFKASPRAQGHANRDNTTVTISAYGRDLLIMSGAAGYGADPFAPYFISSLSRNTIAVDGQGQGRAGSGAIATPDHPLANRWLTSATFDYAEGAYDAGYADPKSATVHIAVRHERQVIALRNQGIWILTDLLRGETAPMPADETHTYTQTWNFDYSFQREQVQSDAQERRIWTADPQGANIALYHFGATPLTYEQLYGQKDPYRGWALGRNTPAVDVHASWVGKGEQLLVTLIEARKDETSRLAKLEPITDGSIQGFRATLTDGQLLIYQTALTDTPLSQAGITMTGRALLTLADGNGTTRGIALNAHGWTVGTQEITLPNFAFTLQGTAKPEVTDIRYPAGSLPGTR